MSDSRRQITGRCVADTPDDRRCGSSTGGRRSLPSSQCGGDSSSGQRLVGGAAGLRSGNISGQYRVLPSRFGYPWRRGHSSIKQRSGLGNLLGLEYGNRLPSALLFRRRDGGSVDEASPPVHEDDRPVALKTADEGTSLPAVTGDWYRLQSSCRRQEEETSVSRSTQQDGHPSRTQYDHGAPPPDKKSTTANESDQLSSPSCGQSKNLLPRPPRNGQTSLKSGANLSSRAFGQ